jgi:Fe2+ or Zn2+ uptake regulation protein
MVRTVPTGNASEIREVYDTRVCRGCQGLLVAPHVQLGYKACHCTPGERGHRTLRCLDCGTVHFEPAHVESILDAPNRANEAWNFN